MSIGIGMRQRNVGNVLNNYQSLLIFQRNHLPFSERSTLDFWNFTWSKFITRLLGRRLSWLFTRKKKWLKLLKPCTVAFHDCIGWYSWRTLKLAEASVLGWLSSVDRQSTSLAELAVDAGCQLEAQLWLSTRMHTHVLYMSLVLLAAWHLGYERKTSWKQRKY